MRKTKAAPATETAPEALDYSRWNQTFRDAKRFFDYAAGYPIPAGAADGLSYYVYRVMSPKIDRSLNGIDANYIGVFSERIDEDFIRGEYGSGKFNVILNDANRPAATRQVASCTFEINDLRAPAKFVPEELIVEDAANQRWLDQCLADGYVIETRDFTGPKGVTVKRKCLRRAAAAAPAPAVVVAAPAPAGLAALDNAIITLLTKLTPAPVAARDPFEIAMQIRQMTTGPAAPALDPLVKTMLEKWIERQFDAPAPAMPAAAAAPQAPADAITAALDLADKISKRSGGGGGGDWSGVARDFVNNLGVILAGGAALVQAFRGAPVTATPAAVVVPAPAAVVPGAANIEELLGGQDLDIRMIPELQRIGMLAVDAYKRGISGDDFADSLHPGEGLVEGTMLGHSSNPNDEKLYDWLHAQGVATIIGAIRMLPGGLLDSLPDGGAGFEQFVRDFVGYGDPAAGVTQ